MRAASAADIYVMISAAYYQVYAELGPAFEKSSGHRLVTTRGPSIGDSPEAIPNTVAAVVARGEAEIGFQQVSELIHTSGVTVVGAIPAELQPGFSFAAALTTAAKEADAAQALIRFLNSPDAAPGLTLLVHHLGVQIPGA